MTLTELEKRAVRTYRTQELDAKGFGQVEGYLQAIKDCREEIRKAKERIYDKIYAEKQLSPSWRIGLTDYIDSIFDELLGADCRTEEELGILPNKSDSSKTQLQESSSHSGKECEVCHKKGIRRGSSYLTWDCRYCHTKYEKNKGRVL